MPAEQLKIGDVVRLKSGGPPMTITDVGQDHDDGKPVVWVSWFDEKKQVANGYFPAESVER